MEEFEIRTDEQIIAEDDAALLQAARQALENAYAPYSGFRVGAAVRTESGRIYSGCNVENASYGLTICAERSAIFGAVSTEGSNCRVLAIALATDDDVDCAPCGACRQVLAEFGPSAAVIFPISGAYRMTSLDRLLPYQFRLQRREQ